MSKAFTKESDGQDDDEGPGEGKALPAGTKNYMTPSGFQKLKDELHQLLNVERPALVKTVSWAASNGDRSENADYIYGKRRLRQIDSRIRFLTKRLDGSEVVDPVTQKSDKVLFGATVTVSDEEGKKATYQIVGIDESEPAKKKISWISPIAKALLGAAVGDVVTLRSPKGEEELEILKKNESNIERLLFSDNNEAHVEILDFLKEFKKIHDNMIVNDNKAMEILEKIEGEIDEIEKNLFRLVLIMGSTGVGAIITIIANLLKK